MQTTEVRFPMEPLMELFERQADAADFWEVDVRRVREWEQTGVCWEFDFITCEHGDGQFTLVPVDPDGRWEVSVEVGYSESRDQYRATLRRMPHVERD